MNKVMLIGRVGKDPDVRAFNDNSKIANVTLATTERGYKLQNGTEVPEHTDWHNLRIRGGLVNVVEKYIHKGDRLYVEGRVNYREYEKDGKKFYATDIIVDELEMLTEKKDNASAPASAPAPQAQDDGFPF